jgi:hypothetical protein
LAPGDFYKRRALVGRNLEAVGQHLGHLPGRPPLIALDLAQGRHRVAHLPGKLFSGQVERFALPGNPGTK